MRSLFDCLYIFVYIMLCLCGLCLVISYGFIFFKKFFLRVSVELKSDFEIFFLKMLGLIFGRDFLF